MHSEWGRGVDIPVSIDVRLLSPWVGARVLDPGLHVHHLDGQVVELLLRRHPVAVEAVLADDVRVEVGRHARAGAHLHVLHRT